MDRTTKGSIIDRFEIEKELGKKSKKNQKKIDFRSFFNPLILYLFFLYNSTTRTLTKLHAHNTHNAYNARSLIITYYYNYALLLLTIIVIYIYYNILKLKGILITLKPIYKILFINL